MINVKGKLFLFKNSLHCGSEGHWLETQMGIIHNSKNEPDILGYEMKKNSSKITIGDFSASEYLFSTKKDNIENINSEFNGLDFDYDSYLKQGDYYHDKIKTTYKLHLVISDTKTLFIYDNVEDKIHNFTSPASVFNACDYHDSHFGSYGISIQFPMNPYFLKNEIKEYLELS